jgi:hypothetical protein
MDNNNLNILVEAKKEYLAQICTVMYPIVLETFLGIYSEAYKMTKGKKVLVQFQKLLREVANWNNHMIHQHTDAICKNCSFFDDLLAAVFVSYVKILSSVRLNSNKSKISIKMPNNQVFVHACYVNIARDIYKDPYVFHEETNEYERDEKLLVRFTLAIEQTVKELVPVQKILETYMSKKSDQDNIDVMSEAPEDSEDPDIMDEDFQIPETETFPEPETEPEIEPEPLPEGAEPDPEPVDEMKTVNLDKKTNESIQPDEDDGVLFGNAPEGKRNSPDI